jgi:hypothetical protein
MKQHRAANTQLELLRFYLQSNMLEQVRMVWKEACAELDSMATNQEFMAEPGNVDIARHYFKLLDYARAAHSRHCATKVHAMQSTHTPQPHPCAPPAVWTGEAPVTRGPKSETTPIAHRRIGASIVDAHEIPPAVPHTSASARRVRMGTRLHPGPQNHFHVRPLRMRTQPAVELCLVTHESNPDLKEVVDAMLQLPDVPAQSSEVMVCPAHFNGTATQPPTGSPANSNTMQDVDHSIGAHDPHALTSPSQPASMSWIRSQRAQGSDVGGVVASFSPSVLKRNMAVSLSSPRHRICY